VPKRTSINDVQTLTDLNDLKLIVKDKRVDKRAGAKKERRNRHYVKVLIKSQLHSGSKERDDPQS
jgi:hypothetical protein